MGRLHVPAAKREPSGGFDGATALTIYLILLLGIPGRLTVSQLGAAGSPARIFGLLLLGWWATAFLARSRAKVTRLQMLPWAMAALLFGICVSYVGAMVRPISPAEIRAADMAVLTCLSNLGVFVIAYQGIPSSERLQTLIRRMAAGIALVATLGVLQFIVNAPLVDRISIPGLTGEELISSALVSREGFPRPSGTALHPIEFGVSIAAGLAFALYWALDLRQGRPLWRWLSVFMIAVAIPLSISRSALLGLLVVLAVLIPNWAKDRRDTALALLPLGLLAMAFYGRGLLRELVQMFTGVGEDASVASRTDGYATVAEYVAGAPLFGRGPGTFLPAYRILDNQYLLTLIESGVLGMVSLGGLFLAGVFTAIQIGRDGPDDEARMLGVTLTAATASAAVGFAFFDGLSFPIYSGMTFLVLGITAGARRFQLETAMRSPANAILAPTGTRARGSTELAGRPSRPLSRKGN